MVAYKCSLLRMIFSKCMLQNPRANEPSHGPSRASQHSGPLLARLLNKARCLRAEPTPRPARLTPHLARLGSAQLGPVLMLGEPARLFANPDVTATSYVIARSHVSAMSHVAGGRGVMCRDIGDIGDIGDIVPDIGAGFSRLD